MHKSDFSLFYDPFMDSFIRQRYNFYSFCPHKISADLKLRIGESGQNFGPIGQAAN